MFLLRPSARRPQRRALHRLSAVIAVAVLTLAACGGDETTQSDGSSQNGESDGQLTSAPAFANIVEGETYRPETLHYASISGADEESSAQRAGVVVDWLSEELDMPIDYVETTDYGSVIEAMRAGRVDFSLFGPFSFVIASTEANAEPLVASPNQETGDLGYHSLIIVPADSDAQTIADLEGKAMAFADPASTSGHLFPRLMLAQEGITDLDSFFSEQIFSGGHDASLVGVANGQLDAAGVCDQCIERFFDEGMADRDDIRVIAESETIPPSPVSVRADLDPEFKDAIRDAYLRMFEEAPEVMQATRGSEDPVNFPYEEVAEADYDIVRELADELDVDLAELDS